MIYKLQIDAFCFSQELREALEKAAQMRELSKSKIGLNEGGLPAAIKHYQDQTTPSLVLVEEAEGDEDLMEALGQLAQVCDPSTKVVVAGRRNDISLYRTLLSQGVSEYLLIPIGPRQIVDTILAIFTDPEAPPRGRLVAFYGARGGAGSSTIAFNTAWCMTKLFEDEVGIVDLDLNFGTLGLAFNVEAQRSVGEILAQPDRMDMGLVERFMIRHDEYLQILASSAGLRGAVPPDPDSLDLLLDLVRQMVPFVVVDIPHVWDRWVQQLLTSVDDVVITATPDLASLRDTKSLIDTVGTARGETAPPKLVLNRVGAYAKGELSPKDFEETLSIEPVVSIPFEPALFLTAANNGQMVGQESRGARVAELFNQLGMRLSGRAAAPKRKKKGMLSLFSSSKTEKRKNKKAAVEATAKA